MQNCLSIEDVKKLTSDPSPKNRAKTAEKIASQYEKGNLTDKAHKLAEDIFRIMVQDAEQRVREALSSHLKEAPDLPHDVAVKLAHDVESVALPVITYSKVLNDTDLIDIIETNNQAKQKAIAGRSHVSAPVSDKLVNTHNQAVVETLVDNQGAEISETSLQQVISDFGKTETIQGKLIDRNKLPVAVSERLVHMVTEQLQERLVTKHELSPSTAADMVMGIRERATLSLSSGEDEAENLVEHLAANKRLTSTLIIRALCLGDFPFFEHAMARLTNLPIKNVRTLIYDAGQLGLKALFEQAKMPLSFIPAARAAVKLSLEIRLDGAEHDRERYAKRMIEMILTQYGDMGIRFDKDDIEYLLGKMNSLQANFHDA